MENKIYIWRSPALQTTRGGWEKKLCASSLLINLPLHNKQFSRMPNRPSILIHGWYNELSNLTTDFRKTIFAKSLPPSKQHYLVPYLEMVWIPLTQTYSAANSCFFVNFSFFPTQKLSFLSTHNKRYIQERNYRHHAF